MRRKIVAYLSIGVPVLWRRRLLSRPSRGCGKWIGCGKRRNRAGAAGRSPGPPSTALSVRTSPSTGSSPGLGWARGLPTQGVIHGSRCSSLAGQHRRPRLREHQRLQAGGSRSCSRRPGPITSWIHTFAAGPAGRLPARRGKVKRPGYKVTSRKGYFVSRQGAPEDGPLPAGLKAITGVLSDPGVPLRGIAAPLRQADGSSAVAVTVAFDRTAAGAEAGDAVEIVTHLFDPEGRPARISRRPLACVQDPDGARSTP